MVDGRAVDVWRVMCWQDLRAHLIFWRRELAERRTQEEPAAEPEGPPQLGLGIAPRWLVDKLAVDDIGQG